MKKNVLNLILVVFLCIITQMNLLIIKQGRDLKKTNVLGFYIVL